MSLSSLAAMLLVLIIECWLALPGSEAVLYESMCSSSMDYNLDRSQQAVEGWRGFVYCGAANGIACPCPVLYCGFGPSANDIRVEVDPGHPKACGDGDKWTCSCNKLKRTLIKSPTEDGLEAVITIRVQPSAKTGKTGTNKS